MPKWFQISPFWRRQLAKGGYEREASPVNGDFEANEKGIKNNSNTSSCRDPPHNQHTDDALTYSGLSFSSLSVVVDPAVEKARKREEAARLGSHRTGRQRQAAVTTKWGRWI